MEGEKNISNTLASLALVVAVAALIMAWITYDRQAIYEAKETVRLEKNQLDAKMEDAAQKTEATTREAAGAVMEKTGEVIEATGTATQNIGTDIKKDGQAMPQ